MTADIAAGRHGGDKYSTAANPPSAIKERDRTRIWGWVRTRRDIGAICDEAEVALGMTHQTASARFSELRRLGLLEDTGRSRLTRSGRPARVHIAVTP